VEAKEASEALKPLLGSVVPMCHQTTGGFHEATDDTLEASENCTR